MHNNVEIFESVFVLPHTLLICKCRFFKVLAVNRNMSKQHVLSKVTFVLTVSSHGHINSDHLFMHTKCIRAVAFMIHYKNDQSALI